MNKLYKTISYFDLFQTLFTGMGNRIKQDDGVGIYIAQELKKLNQLNVVIAENSIENYLGKINNFKGSSLVFFDAVDFGKTAGYSELLPVDKMTDTTSNTHNLSLRTISRFLTVKDLWIWGVQPVKVSFGVGLSPEIKKTADKIIHIIQNVEYKLKK